MLAAIWEAIKVLPVAVAALKEVVSLLQKAFGDNPTKFLVDVADARGQLQAAKTSEDKLAAAKKLVELIERL